MSVNVYDPVNDTLTPIAGATLYADVGVGSIIAFAGKEINLPEGYLAFNGQTVKRGDYPDLWAFAVANEQVGVDKFFSQGDGSTTFTLADLRETSLKGYGETSRSVGAHVKSGGLGIGEFIDDRIQDHKHVQGGVSDSWAGQRGTDERSILKIIETGVDPNTARVGTTTEVKAVGVVWAVKAKQVGLPIDLQQQMENYIIERSIPVSHPITPATGITARDFSGYIKSGNVITVILGQMVPSSNLGPFAPLLQGLPNPPQVTPFMTSIGYCFIDADGNVRTGRDTSVSAGATIDGTFTYTV